MRVLFVSPTNMGLYKDVMAEMERQGHDVVFAEDAMFKSRIFADSYSYVKRKRPKCVFLKRRFNNNYWKRTLAGIGDLRFDCLFVIDGFSLCDDLFRQLEAANPRIKKILYLYDSAQGYYKFHLNFCHFDKVYTFDIDDAERFSLRLLPIYWVPEDKHEQQYDVFGFATYSQQKYEFYKVVRKTAEAEGLRHFVKLYDGSRKAEVSDDWVVSSPLPPSEFRRMTDVSRVVVDAVANQQAGQTARFSWAIGAGKKIITNNTSVKRFPFYDESLIFVYEEGVAIPADFLKQPVEMSDRTRTEVNKFRIDNWVGEMLN